MTEQESASGRIHGDGGGEVLNVQVMANRQSPLHYSYTAGRRRQRKPRTAHGCPAMDHDRLFKELLTTFFVEFLQLFFQSAEADGTGLIIDGVRES
jgi:hypothetical protein